MNKSYVHTVLEALLGSDIYPDEHIKLAISNIVMMETLSTEFSLGFNVTFGDGFIRLDWLHGPAFTEGYWTIIYWSHPDYHDKENPIEMSTDIDIINQVIMETMNR